MFPIWLAVLAGLAFALPAHGAAAITLARGGDSAYTIVRPAEATPAEARAADELQRFLGEITGVAVPIADDTGPLPARAILVGPSRHLNGLGIDIDFEALGREGFVIRTAPPHLIIAGGRPRGTLYGVYAFLEEHLGCRWFTPEVSHIPRIAPLEIGAIDAHQVPDLEYREAFFKRALDPDWAARNRLNSSFAELGPEHGGKVTYYPFVHTFYTLIPPEEHFETHPEWFAEVDGERTLVGRYRRAQICLTNEEVIAESIRVVRQWIEDHPEATIFSVSQNDGPGGWCECTNCAAVEAEQGGAHAAPIIYFVNRIADAVAEDYPHVAIDTLAYSYSLKAPKDLKPRPNVIIRMTTGACVSHAIGDEKCEKNAGMRQTIQDWFRLTDRIYIWDYIVNFRQYLLPFPNLHTLQPNLQFFVDHGVRGVFEQGSGDVLDSDMAPLKGYLVAKLLWNPDYDVDRAMTEFLEAYYGAAAAPIRAYIDAVHAEVQGSDYHRLHMSPFEPGTEPAYLTPEVLALAVAAFDEAERLVADQPEYLLRVEALRLSLDYVKLQTGARLAAMVGPGEGAAIRNWFQGAMDDFFTTAERAGVTHMREAARSSATMADFRAMLEAGLRYEEGTGAEIE